ncbi:hypothetical protein SLS56_012149 [Neofusicoccum ribis]|uniref:Uncharacterized protein n=1 Tax=Neofusicoccum ribis TaxID=45134 RepID=A0ABR3S9N5_9PEZI
MQLSATNKQMDTSRLREADKELRNLREALGINIDDLPSNERYDDSIALAAHMKTRVIECLEDNYEGKMTKAHQPFDYHDKK